MLTAIVNWLAELIFVLGYPGITLLMAIESSFIPFPSEVVLPPAGYLAAQGRMNAWLATGAGLLGSLIGATMNYYLAAVLGRRFLHRYHKFFLISETKLERAERFFRRHGEISTFIGRLIPVIRQLISLPAGIARMRVDRFLVYTGIGAGIWCAILTYIGWYVGRHATVIASVDELIGSEEFGAYSGKAALALLPLIAVTLAVYVLWQRHRRSRARHDPEQHHVGP